MKVITNKFVYLFTILVFAPFIYGQDLNLNKLLQPTSKQAVFRLENYMVWCGSPIKGKDGKFYLFYSRWPRKLTHQAWATHSEIAVAVSNKANGPYKHVKVILPKREKKYWDADVTHNPNIHRFGDTYYLYYMGNYGNGEWWDHRNHQRIGVAVSKNPLGPWKRFDKPIVDTSYKSFDHMIASNPSVVKQPNGKYLMIYKGVSEGKLPFGGIVLHGAAISSNPVGPFIKQSQRIFVKDTVRFAAEDPYIWYQKGKYWAIVKDFKGSFTNSGLSLALFESPNGLDWKPGKNALVSKTIIPFKSGDKLVEKLERPQLLFVNGIPISLFCAVYDKGDNYNIAIPLKKN
ncbi:MAG: hypothetical protein RL108_343 [Bacteroidota bacterium]|jgi:predicted GH43/DUF377 family glycosyl hydrolase